MIFLNVQEEVILTLDNSAQIFNALSDIPGDITDADLLIQVMLPQNLLATSVKIIAHKMSVKIDNIFCLFVRHLKRPLHLLLK